ncbi:MAG: PAS domain S-box protein [Woeseia sp.]
MNLDLGNSRVSATIIGSACLFALAYWLLDAGSMLWHSDAGFFSALVPDDGQFPVRVLFASLFAISGALVGAALQRNRHIETIAEGQLTESERKYQALLAASFDSILILGNDARVVELNDSAAMLFGSSTRAMIGTAIDDFVEVEAGMNPHQGRQVSDMLRAAVADNSAGIVVRVRAQKGRRFPAEIRVAAMPAGSASAYLLAIRETTTSVLAEKALRSSERRYQSLFDNIPDGVYRSLPDGRLLAANPALVRMLGYDSAEQLISQGSTRNLYCDQQQRAGLIAKLEKTGEARNVEIQLQRRDGRNLLALANIRAIVSENNEDVVYEGTLSDISDLQAARDALRDSEEHFRALCEHSLDIINVINKDGEILYSSPASFQLTQRKPEEQLGLTLFRSVHPEDAPVVSAIIKAGFARPGMAKRFTCRLYREDGSLRYIDAVGTAFLTRHGELRAVINSRDVTDHVETEARLRELEKIRVVGSLTKGLTNEFNSILATLFSKLRELRDHNDNSALNSRIAAAFDACERGKDLTRRMTAFANRGPARPERVLVGALLDDIAPVLRRSLGEKVTLETHYADDLWQVRADQAQLQGVILLLALGAAEAIGETGSIVIAARNHPHGRFGPDLPDAASVVDFISIRIRNNGKGVSNEALTRATPSADGTAGDEPGLSAVRRFVASAGGELRVCKDVDSLAEVTMFLPRARQSAECSSTSAKRQCCSEHVLVVDQNAEVRQATASLLASAGYQVSQANNGEAALQLLESENIDLLFADLKLAPLSGVELAERVRSAHPATKILLTSGGDAATTGVSDDLNIPYELIRKPFGRQRLAEQVRLVLET